MIAVAVINIKSATNAYEPAPGNSAPVRSNQRHLHPRLAEVVRRHLHTSHRATPSAHGVDAYTRLTRALHDKPRPLVLDSFCGTGHSTAALATRHPDHLVVGVDKSGHRLGRHPGGDSDNYLLLQANCEDIWRLLVEDGRRVDFHYLLYPNPWPKAAQLQRRVHGHASFPLLLQLGGRIELRSNWQIYVEEFGAALFQAGYPAFVRQLPSNGPDLSLFEAKYRRSGHTLWSCLANLTS